MSNEKYISERECDARYTALSQSVTKVDGRVSTIETRFWTIILLLVSNLAGVIAILVKF